MSWPEDNVDFDDLDPIEEMGGDALSAAELAAIAMTTEEIKRPGGALRETSDPNFPERRRKIPCGQPPEKPVHVIAEPEMPSKSEIDEIKVRQDKLAEATLKSLERISKRMDRLEARPVPLFSLAAWQKGCLFIFTLAMMGVIALFTMSAIIHYNGWVK